jgi:hypothetical protein
MLYRSTDRLCRCGAPVQYLSHSASFHSLEKYAPPNAGTKHLVKEKRQLTSSPSWRANRAPVQPPKASVIQLRASLDRQLRRA